MNFAGCFLKFGEMSHIMDMQKKGILYCNPINYFTEIDDGNVRGDDLENVVEMIYMESGIVLLGKPEKDPALDGVKMPFKDAKITGRIVEPFGNLFCMYTINLLEKPIGHHFTIDVQMKKFGEYFLLIQDTREFLQRVKAVIDKMKLAMKGDLVSYLNLSNYSGKKSVFQKDIKYSYQHEYRIFINSKKPNPIIIEIGDIEDISILCEACELKKLIVAGKQKIFPDSQFFLILK